MRRVWEAFRGWPVWAQWTVGIVAALLVLGALVPGDSDEETVSSGAVQTTQASAPAPTTAAAAPATTSAPRTTSDRRARDSKLACEHFRNVARDVSRGVLTDAELRRKLKEVDDDAVIGTPEVRAAATAMLAGITTGTTESFLQAIKEMDAACSAAGH